MNTQNHLEFHTLPAPYYTDPVLFRTELEKFYFTRWIHAGRANAIPNPGDYFLCDIAGESIIVLREASGDIRAFYNVCRHRGTRLCSDTEGNCGTRILCSYHGWSWSLDGRLLGAPHMDAPTFRHEDYPLHAAHVDTWDGHLFLHCGAQPKPLAAQLGPLPEKFANWGMEELRLHRRIIYDVHANWKLVVANYNECLHCPLVHPALDRLTDYLDLQNEPPTENFVGGSMGFREGAVTMSLDGKRRRAFLPGLTDEQRKQVCYYAIFPNLLLSLHPDYMMVHTIWPKAVDQSRIVCEWHFHPDELAKPDFHGDDAIDFWDMTNREDWRMVELSQAGIQSRAYTPGPYSAREELVQAFDRVIRSTQD